MENFVPAIFEITIQQIRVHRSMKYPCHICGDTRYKIIGCPKYNDMQNMFNDKGIKIAKKSFVVEPKVANPLSSYGGCQHG